ncbi:MAG: hypothetical protein ACOCVF_01435 [bacterium]
MKSFSWSLDISTTNVGMALWDGNGKLVELKHLQLKVDRSIPEENRYLHKAKMFKNYIKEYKVKIEKEFGAKIVNIFVEAPLVHTSINRNTTAKLLGFNGITCYILCEVFNVEPFLISVYDSRKIFFPELVNRKKVKGKIKETLSFPKNIDKKEYIWKKVNSVFKNIEWSYDNKGKLKKQNFDMSDSVVVGVCGLIVANIIPEKNWVEYISKLT